MVGWLLNLAYAAAMLAGSPVWLTRMLRHGKYRRDWRQRLGWVPRRYGLQPVIWIHGVSVGEVSAARPLVAGLHEQLPDFQVVVSSTTDTGLAAARRLFAPDHVVFRWPMDFTFAVRAALDRLGPAAVILMEGDVWPNFARQCGGRGIPVVVVNARLGPRKGFPRYRLVRPLAGRMFNALAAIGVQHEAYADLFRALGVRDDRLHVTGMMKFDSADIADRVAGQDALALAVGIAPGERLLVAGGTGAGEERLILEAYRRLLDTAGPRGGGSERRLRLAIVPRKPQRFDPVARLIGACGFACVRRSQRPDGATGQTPGLPKTTGQTPGLPAVILGDTMGELRKFYALAAAVFVGRSLVPMGGSDMIEAAALGRPTAFGPHTFNFPQAEELVRHGCARVAGAEELGRQLSAWLSDAGAAAQAGRTAQDYVRSQQGATRRNVEMICRVLGRVPAVAPGCIATDELAAAPGAAGG
jgi:3-deoxy-D-manno-octulosonic-acid transferase